MQTSTIHTTDVTLSNVAIQRGMNDYLSEKIFPPFNSQLQTAKILSIDPAGDLRRRKDTKRAPGAVANSRSIEITRPVRFACEGHAQREFIPDEHRATYATEIQAAMEATGNAMETLLLDKEIATVEMIEAAVVAGTITTDSPGSKWDDPAGDPIGDLKRKLHAIAKLTGVKPNRLAMDSAVLDFIAENADFIDRMKYTQLPEQSATAVILAAILGLPPGAIQTCNIALQNTAVEGQDESLSRIWGDNVLMYYQEPPKLKTMNFGMTVNWNHPELAPRAKGGIVNGIRVTTYRVDERDSDCVQADWWYEMLLLQPKVAHWFTNTTTALS